MRYDCVIFDLDGTLLDTLDDIRDSLNHTLAQYGLREQSLDEVRAHVGNGSARLVELSLPGGREHPLFEAALRGYGAWYVEHCLIKTAPYPGIMELLRRLKGAGVKTAVVSNKPDGAVKSLDKALFPGLLLAAVGERPGVRRKPAPDGLLAAMEALGAEAGSCVYIGDTEVDIMTARNAGVPCVCVSWGFRTREQLIDSGAAEIAADADELWLAING